jgi:hypothetical protein
MRPWLLLAGPVLLAGCTETVESTDVRTSGIYPEIEVVGDGTGRSVVTVELKVGGDDSNTYLELEGSDRLEATAGGETKTLTGSGSRYRATFDVDGAGTRFVIAFLRGSDDDDAPSSIATLPDPFRVSSDLSEASRALQVDVPFRWEPAGDEDDEDEDSEMYWFIEGRCILDEDGETPDDGEAVIPSEQIQTLMSNANAACEVDLALSRRQSGELDRAFTEGGRIIASQRRNTTFISSP